MTVNDQPTLVVGPGEKGPPPNYKYGRTMAVIQNIGDKDVFIRNLSTGILAEGIRLRAATADIEGGDVSVGPFGELTSFWGQCAAGESTDVRVIRVDA